MNTIFRCVRLLFVVLGLAACTAPEAPAGKSRAPIINGDETLLGTEDVGVLRCNPAQGAGDRGTGTLLTNDFLITAAHVVLNCLDADQEELDPNSQLTFQLPDGQTANAIAVTVHPRYGLPILNQFNQFFGQDLTDDVALVELNSFMSVRQEQGGEALPTGHRHRMALTTPALTAGTTSDPNFLRCFGWGVFTPHLISALQCPIANLPDEPTERLRNATFRVFAGFHTNESVYIERNETGFMDPVPFQAPDKGDSGGPCGSATEEWSREPIEGVMAQSFGECTKTFTRLVHSSVFAPWVVSEMGAGAVNLLAIDADFDGSFDDISLDETGVNSSNLHVELTSGILPPLDVPLPFALDDDTVSMAFGLFNADLFPDLAILQGGSLSVLEGTPIGFFEGATAPDLTQFQFPGAPFRFLDLADTNGDGFPDLRVTASNGLFQSFLSPLGGGNGIGALPVLATVDAPINDVSGDDRVNVVVVDESGNPMLHMETSFGPRFPLGIEYTDPDRPVELLAVDLNGSSATPGKEIVLMVNGDLRYYEWNGFGALEEQNAPRFIGSNLGTGFIVDLTVDHAHELGESGSGTTPLDTLTAVFDTGETRVFSGNPLGAPSGNALFMDGLPTPVSFDGKFLTVSGQGLATVAATETRLRLAVPEDAPATALDDLVFEIFDGDVGGLNDHGDNVTSDVKTCYLLTADPCGNAGLGECDFNDEATQGTFLAAWDSNDMADNEWTRITMPHSCEASFLGDCPTAEPPYSYELRIFLKEAETADSSDCQTPPLPGSQVPQAQISSFKIRSNAVVSHPEGQLSFEGYDTNGDFGTPWVQVPYLSDTAYDGTWVFGIEAASGAGQLEFMESDADYILDESSPGVGFGTNFPIFYDVVDPNGDAVLLEPGIGAEPDDPADFVGDPSGNHDDGDVDRDVESRIFTGPVQAGRYGWEWIDVQAHNNVHIWAPTGSPVTMELLGRNSRRVRLSTAKPRSFWLTPPNAAMFMSSPIVLGSQSSPGRPDGESLRFDTATQVVSFLARSASTPRQRLLRELLVTKLNVRRATTLGERLDSAMIYGTISSVRGSVAAADAIARGPSEITEPDEIDRLLVLLEAANGGQITYFRPGVPRHDSATGDTDGDGVTDLKDNCPPIANTDQTDQDGDRVGDACRVVPLLRCVLGSKHGKRRAFVGYQNPLEFRSIPIGRRNHFDGRQDRGQPSEFEGGLRSPAFEIPLFGNETRTWTLEDSVLEIGGASTSPACSGSELLEPDFAKPVVIFGEQRVEVEEFAHVGAAPNLASIVGESVKIETRASVGSVWAHDDIRIERQALVSGDLVAGDRLFVDRSAVVVGGRSQHAFVPDHDIDFEVNFPRVRRPRDVSVGRHGNVTLDPGRYGDVHVGFGATLRLGAGTYSLETLDVQPGGTILIDNAAGQVTLYVDHSLELDGTTRGASGEQPLLVLSYFGHRDVDVRAPFHGALIAPDAKIRLDATRDAPHSGVFFAREVRVEARANVEYAKSWQ